MATVLVTGAGGNLGRVVVDHFVSRGHNVIALVSPGKTPSGSPSGNLFYYECDLSDEDQTDKVINTAIKHHPVIDAAFLLAGGFAMGNIQNTNWEGILAMLNINFKTAFTVARPVFNQLVNQPAGGVLVFVGAKPALDVKSGKEMLAYTLSKSLVLDFADMLNAQTSGKPVTCKVIVPSTIDTPTNRAAMPKADFSRWNKSEDIARLLERVMLGTGPGDAVIIL